MAIGFLAVLFGVNVLFAQVLRSQLGPDRYEAFTYSPASAASVGVNYHGLRFWNAVLLAGTTLIAILVLPEHAKTLALAGGIGIAMFTGHLVGGAAVAFMLGWVLF